MAGPGFDLFKEGESSEAPAVIRRDRVFRDIKHGGPILPGPRHFGSSARHAAAGPRLSAIREFVA